jgi:dipeptidyl aminopeptidase/acylaminoacyl peptidase
MKALKLALFSAALVTSALAQKPRLTLDEFFNSVSYPSVALSPDGHSVVVTAERADWDQQIFRTDLFLYRELANNPESTDAPLIPLTQSGHDSDPKWSPDGRWIAFLSERKPATEKNPDDEDDDKGRKKGKEDKSDVAQIYLISPSGGEAIPLTTGAEEVHSFCWSADSRIVYYSTRSPWTRAQKDEYKKRWKDVVQYRASERGDTIFALDVPFALARHAAAPAKDSASETELGKDSGQKNKDDKDSDLTPGAQTLAAFPLRVADLVTSPDGAHLGFLSSAINQRQEKFEDYEIYVIDLPSGDRSASASIPAAVPQPRQLTHNQAQESKLRWASDSRRMLFSVEGGDVSGPYRDIQPHLYSVDTQTAAVEQWSKDFPGAIDSFGPFGSGVLATARIGTEVQMYIAAKPTAALEKFAGQPGTYENIATAEHTLRVAYVYSSLGSPAEVYLADGPNLLASARPITSFNRALAEKDLPQGKPYRWKADDGTTIEGMLIYPPGKFEQKNLPLFTFIHGGPADADGNHFEADWYQWSALAATEGWLVFEPNYRGSTGYGDKFIQQIVPTIVSRPGKDILEGVDALVKDGIADPAHLAVGGYSYGGYMTNWLITQTTRFKAAVTGAGAVEHVGNWGNDDTTFDDAYFLGGRPWEAPQRYHDEAAIFQIDKVKTPTHMVAGADDIRVAVLEDYLLEHALYSLGIPNALLIFPSEGHGLGKNPWHGKIKVREELEWLQKYGGVPAAN